MASFTVKATYKGETRKLTSLTSVSFPSYGELQEQLSQVFTCGPSVYLSKLIFCPAPGNGEPNDDETRRGLTRPLPPIGKQILIGMEARNQAEYDCYIAPYTGGVFPGGILKVNVYDAPASRSASTASTSTRGDMPRRLSNIISGYNPSYMTPAPTRAAPPMSMAAIPPPPILFSSPSRNSSPVDTDPYAYLFKPSVPVPFVTVTPPAPNCCQVSQKKEELQNMMTSFIRDLDRIATTTFGVSAAQALSPQASTSAPQVPAKPWAEGSTRAVPQEPRPLPVPTPSQTRTQRAVIVPVVTDETVVHRGIMCDGCRNTVVGPRFKCMKCKDFDYCSGCLNDTSIRTKHSASHKFYKIAYPSDAIHKGIVCDACEMTIAGVRHKCLDCRDFDLCTTCMRDGALQTLAHDPFHEFFEIKEPGRVVVHTVRSGSVRSEATAQPAPEVPTVQVTPTPVPNSVQQSVYHPAICDLCESQIIGERYKCLSCPDFDICSSCFVIAGEQHPVHGFVRVKAKEDLIVNATVQPQARHAAWCNACKKVIAGVRYKCMHPSCPDYDLCADCEALPIAIHPALHPLLKMKTVDTVIPTVYRVGQTTLIPRLQPAVVQEDSVKSVLVPSRMVIPEVKIPVVHQAEIATFQDSPSAFESGTSEQASSLIQFDGFANEQTVVKLPPSTIGSSSPLSNETLLAAPADRSEMTIDEEAALLRLQENLRSISVTPTISELVVADTTIEKDTCRMPGGMPEELAAPMTPTSETKDGAVPEMIQRRDSPVIAAPVNVQPTTPLVAKFISDLNIADGQVFPPGAEFVKSWVLENAGSRHWPEDTELRFVAGDRMGTESKTIIGGAPAGSEVTISTPELKAPETPGRYVAYWRLFDGEGFAFGTSVWIDITVTEVTQEESSSDISLASSSIIMPHAPSGPSMVSPTTVAGIGSDSHTSVSISEDGMSIIGSDMSLVDAPSINSDEDVAQVNGERQTSTSPNDMEYVVLYDDAMLEED